jgi:hypothetical protein
MPFIYVNHPGKIAIKAMQPLPAQGSLPAVESGRGWSGERLGMGLRLPLTDSWRWLGQWSLRRRPAAWRRSVAAAALLARQPAARHGPLVAGLAMGAEGEVARSAGTSGSAPRRHWPCRQRWRGQGAVMPCSASERSVRYHKRSLGGELDDGNEKNRIFFSPRL